VFEKPFLEILFGFGLRLGVELAPRFLEFAPFVVIVSRRTVAASLRARRPQSVGPAKAAVAAPAEALAILIEFGALGVLLLALRAIGCEFVRAVNEAEAVLVEQVVDRRQTHGCLPGSRTRTPPDRCGGGSPPPPPALPPSPEPSSRSPEPSRPLAATMR